MPSKHDSSLHQELLELDEVLAWFDQPDIDLDQAMQKFDHGVRLAESAKVKLTQLENKISILKQRFDQPI
jgi:exodeoxyribonuclease VII small subunit